MPKYIKIQLSKYFQDEYRWIDFWIALPMRCESTHLEKFRAACPNNVLYDLSANCKKRKRVELKDRTFLFLFLWGSCEDPVGWLCGGMLYMYIFLCCCIFVVIYVYLFMLLYIYSYICKFFYIEMKYVLSSFTLLFPRVTPLSNHQFARIFPCLTTSSHFW